MKVKIDLECTPEEARTFFGLPDVQPMQKAMMQEMQDRLMSAVKGTDAETLMKTWMPAGVAGLEQMQKLFWQQFRSPPGAAGPGGTEKK
ncbi:MAG TPA: DUF6489 family protein [Dongiaceae bacterium]